MQKCLNNALTQKFEQERASANKELAIRKCVFMVFMVFMVSLFTKIIKIILNIRHGSRAETTFVIFVLIWLIINRLRIITFCIELRRQNDALEEIAEK